MAFDKAKFLVRFIDEAEEHIKGLNEGILMLEKNPGDMDTLNAVFRTAHTIKGSARMMKLLALSDLAHKLEDTLDALRNHKIEQSKALTNLMLEGVDAISKMLSRISAGEEIEEPPRDIFNALQNAAEGGLTETGAGKREEAFLENIQEDSAGGFIRPEDTNDGQAEDPEPVTDPECGSDPPEPPIKPSRKSKPDQKQETVRIGSDKLDELIKLMGEIVSANSRSGQRLLKIREIEQSAGKHLELIASFENSPGLSEKERVHLFNSAESIHGAIKKFVTAYREDLNVQNLLSGDLQDRSLRMRMQPLSTIFDSFKLSVRNIAVSAGKDVDFIIEGGQTELDKKIIDQIGDSLLHMIRNSIDHGLESPEVRRRLGKPETGVIRLSAAYEGGNVAIEITDDGKGLSIPNLKEKAIRKGLWDEDTNKNATEAEIINLIFEPGFSTSEIISDLSGRGVGMDVVRKNIIENLKGSIHIETAESRGTSFSIKLPLTMAIIHVLHVAVAGVTFAVPTTFIREIAKISTREVIRVTDKKAVRLRERIIPIISMKDILSIPSPESGTDFENSEYLILIVSIGNEEFGLIVNSLIKEEDVVIKPLPAHMANVRFVSGCIISGTNEIVNVLHIPGVIAEARESKAKIRRPEQKTDSAGPKNILVVDDSISTREIEKDVLESYGYRVSLAGNGAEGLEKAEKESFDLIITDVEMPFMDGFTLTERLRETGKYSETPVILVTSLDKEEDKKRGVLAGADAYIVKGDFEQTALVETVRSLLG